MIEIKSGKAVSLDSQMTAQYSVAAAKHIPLNLVVSPQTQYISGPLQDAIKATGGRIVIFDPETKVFTDWSARTR